MALGNIISNTHEGYQNMTLYSDESLIGHLLMRMLQDESGDVKTCVVAASNL